MANRMLTVVYTLLLATVIVLADGDDEETPYHGFGDNPHVMECKTDGQCYNGFHCDGTKCVEDGCFPGDASVETIDSNMKTHVMKTMDQLEIGDKVLISKNGTLAYSDIYAFGHKDHVAWSKFLRIELKSTTSFEISVLEITGRHYLPAVSDAGKLAYRYAEVLKPGDKLWGRNSSLTITAISNVEKQGLFNPLTLSGTIMVNNVMASAHSDWFLDSIIYINHFNSWFPYIYQMVLSPFRVIYGVLGENVYATIYQTLDDHFNIADTGRRLYSVVY